MLISYFTSPIDTKAGQIPTDNLTIEQVVELVKSDKFDLIVQAIRSREDKKEANALKKQLPYVTFSGTFAPTRLEKSLVQHSGQMSLDFDDVANLLETRVQLQSDPYVRLCFISPRNNGLKIVVEIAPCSVEKHKEYFYDLSQYFQQTYDCAPTADKQCCDITRACFLSHDPDVYFNPDSLEYKIKGLATPKKLREPKPVAVPITDVATHVEAVVKRIEEARTNICGEPGDSYTTRLLLGFSMASLGETGRDFYHRIATFHPEYDGHEYDKKFDNFTKTTRFTTPGYFFDTAKKCGIDISKPKAEIPLPHKVTKAEKEAKNDAKKKEVVKPENVKDKPEKKKKEEAKEEVESSNVTYTYSGGITIYGNKNWVKVADNFQLFIKYCTEDENEQLTWILELKLADKSKDPIYLEVSHEEFCSAKRLKDAIAAKRLSLKITDNYLGELQSYLFKTQFATAEKVSRFGWHPESKVFFFANKAVVGPDKLAVPDEFGIIQAGNVYLSMPVTNKKKLNRFTLTESTMTFNEWFQHLSDAHKRENAFLPACFYLMTLFRDLVITHTKASPILYLKGGASTGKSSIIRSISNLFGFEQQGVNLKNKNTEAALVRLMSQSSNTIIWFDEYNNEFPYEGLLQAAYDNDGYHRASDTTSSATDSVDIYSALALTSNYLPDNPIFFSRCIFVPITEQKKTSEQIDAFNRLRDLEKVGFGAVTVEMLKYRALIERAFPKAYDNLYTNLKFKLSGESVVERLISNMARVMTIPYILQTYEHINMGFEVCDPDSVLEEFIEIGIANIKRQNHIQSEKTALSEFFEIVQYAYEQNLIHEGIHFRIDHDLLYLRFPSIYTIYQQKFRQINFKPGADRDTLRQEIIAFEQGRDEEDVVKNIRFQAEDLDDTARTTKVVNNSWSVTYSKICDKFGLDFQQYKRI